VILKLHRRAEAEIHEATEWYSKQSHSLGRRFLGAVREALLFLESDPRRFAKLETLVDDLSIRRILLTDFPYVIVYEVFDAEVFVYALAHMSRRPNYWRRRKRGAS
jgi:hypothetical protein